jgi:hypothetical protein
MHTLLYFCKDILLPFRKIREGRKTISGTTTRIKTSENIKNYLFIITETRKCRKGGGHSYFGEMLK